MSMLENRPMFAQPSRHRKRCDMSRCRNFAVMDFSRCGGQVGKFDLCQDCIDEIAKYATKATPAQEVKTPEVKAEAYPCDSNCYPEPDAKYICRYCGRECASQIGLSSHERHCKDRPQI